MQALTDYLAFQHRRDLTERPQRLLPRTLVSSFGIKASHSALLHASSTTNPQPAASLATLADAQVRPPDPYPSLAAARPLSPPSPSLRLLSQRMLSHMADVLLKANDAPAAAAFTELLRKVSVYGQSDWLPTGIYLTALFGQCVTDHGRLDCLKWDTSAWDEARFRFRSKPAPPATSAPRFQV